MNAFQASELISDRLRRTIERRTLESLPPEENVWQASSLLASLLEQAEIRPSLRLEEGAATVVNRMGSEGRHIVDRLLEKHLLRVVLGRLALPWSVTYARITHVEMDAQERQAFDTINLAMRAADDEPRLSTDAAKQLVADFRHVHHHAPDFQELLERGVLIIQDDMVVLGTLGDKRTLWQQLGRRIAAVLWERTPALDVWLERVRRLRAWPDAPEEMSLDRRLAFLNLATETVLREPDLLDWPGEQAKLRLETDHPKEWFSWDPPRHETPAAMMQWWDAFQRGHRWLVFRNQARNDLDALIASIVRHDPIHECAWTDRLTNVKRLVRGSVERVHLAAELPARLVRRPEAIGWLLPNSDTAAYGLNLISRLHPHLPGRALEVGSDADVERVALKTELWNEASKIFLEVVRSSSDEQGALAIRDACLPEANQAWSDDPFQPSRAETQSKGAIARLDRFFQELRPRWSNPVLVSHLAKAVLATTRISPRPMTPDFPLGVLDIVGRLLSGLDPSSPLHTVGFDIAESAVKLCVKELTRDRFSPSPKKVDLVRWPVDESAVSRLRWPVFFSWLKSPIRHRYLDDKWPKLAIKRARRTSAVLSAAGREVEEAVAESWESRLRLWLGILIQLHACSVQGLERGQLERAIVSLFEVGGRRDLAACRLNIFDLTSLDVEDNVALLHQASFALNSLETTTALDALQHFVDGAPDVGVLLGLGVALEDAPAELLHSVILRQNLVSYTEGIATFPELQWAIEHALRTHLIGVASSLLAMGDSMVEGLPFATTWVPFSYAVRLRIATATGQDVFAVAAPLGFEPVSPIESPAFHRAIELLDHGDFDNARKAFEELRALFPNEPICEINLFTARLRLAELAPAIARRDAYRSALQSWHEAEIRFAAPSSISAQTAIATNLLFALRGAGDEDSFNTTAQSLEPHIRLRAMSALTNDDVSLAHPGEEWIVRPAPSGLALPKEPLIILAVATEWDSRHGGLSTFNRELCRALQALGHQVICYLPVFQPDEKASALSANVQLIAPRTVVGLAADYVMTTGDGIRSLKPDAIIGHDRQTGPLAQWLGEQYFPQACRVQIIHTAPEMIEWYKNPDQAAQTIDDRKTIQRALVAHADVVAGVGPALFKSVQSLAYNSDLSDDRIIRIDPGLVAINTKSKVPAEISFLIAGRVEDIALKGVDIAATASGLVCDRRGQRHHLIIRGVQAEQQRDAIRQLRQWANTDRLSLEPRIYSSDPKRLQEDLALASIVLMPSRQEGFGLIGLEGIAAGRPTLISRSSGLADLLAEHRLDRGVVPVVYDERRCAEQWCEQMEGLLRNREQSFAQARELRDQLASILKWSGAASALVDGIYRARSSATRAPSQR
jgi:glycosyltransferase involved in cell wall biosynthesis